jgi:chromosome segregation and condensation protein ScpB
MKNHKIVEAILFICGNEGCAASELRGMVQLDSQQLVDLIGELNQKYKNDEDSPFIINLYDKRYYLLTKPDLKPVLEKLNITTKYRNLLSKALIEILSIIL